MRLISALCPRFPEVAAYWPRWPPDLIFEWIFLFNRPYLANFKYLHGEVISCFVDLKLFGLVYDHCLSLTIQIPGFSDLWFQTSDFCQFKVLAVAVNPGSFDSPCHHVLQEIWGVQSGLARHSLCYAELPELLWFSFRMMFCIADFNLGRWVSQISKMIS